MKRILSWSGAFLASLFLVACAQFPSLDKRTVSTAYIDTADTTLGRAIVPLAAKHVGNAGVTPLMSGGSAFAARALMAQAAERSIDIQNYIWHDDMAGVLLFDALVDAANRGVRVRLLLDDNNTVGMDGVLAALDSHDNIEVRLFNPFVQRNWRWLGYLTDFARLNRRMHNKSYTVDNQATIIGGRNVGDEYFGASEEFQFIDLDVLAVGPVVTEVSKDFDRYWESASSYPVDLILAPANEGGLDELKARARSIREDERAAGYVKAMNELPLVKQLLDGSIELEWAVTRMVSDDPSKGLGEADDHEMLPQRLGRIFGVPEQDLFMVSSYFVPTKAGVDYLTALAESGVQVTILTNSLEATDVAAVHAGYAKRRLPLLQSGITLYELKKVTSPAAFRDRGLTGSSASSLHAKTLSVDGQKIFIGSFNFDPRSARLNTEIGFVIESPRLAQNLPAALEKQAADMAYRVFLSDSNELRWEEVKDGERIVHTSEPGASVWRLMGVWILSHLPIEWLL